jgi:hypothetical protein
MNNPRKINEARAIALAKGIITSPDQLDISKAKNKRFVLIKDGKRINFGLFPYSGKGTYLDHGDNKIKSAWIARHSKIKLKDGRQAYKVKDSPEYLSYSILWS